MSSLWLPMVFNSAALLASAQGGSPASSPALEGKAEAPHVNCSSTIPSDEAPSLLSLSAATLGGSWSATIDEDGKFQTIAEQTQGRPQIVCEGQATAQQIARLTQRLKGGGGCSPSKQRPIDLAMAEIVVGVRLDGRQCRRVAASNFRDDSKYMNLWHIGRDFLESVGGKDVLNPIGIGGLAGLPPYQGTSSSPKAEQSAATANATSSPAPPQSGKPLSFDCRSKADRNWNDAIVSVAINSITGWHAAVKADGTLLVTSSSFNEIQTCEGHLSQAMVTSLKEMLRRVHACEKSGSRAIEINGKEDHSFRIRFDELHCDRISSALARSDKRYQRTWNMISDFLKQHAGPFSVDSAAIDRAGREGLTEAR